MAKKKAKQPTPLRVAASKPFRDCIEIEFFLPIEQWRPSSYSRKLAFGRAWDALQRLAAERAMANAA